LQLPKIESRVMVSVT